MHRPRRTRGLWEESYGVQYTQWVYDSLLLLYNYAESLSSDACALARVHLDFLDSNINHSSPTAYWQMTECELGEVKAQRYCEKCPSNMYSLNPNNTSCDICPPYTDCPGGAELRPLEGFWHSPNYPTQMHKCQQLSACLVNGICAPGHYGNLCGSCTQSFGKVRRIQMWVVQVCALHIGSVNSFIHSFIHSCYTCSEKSIHRVMVGADAVCCMAGVHNHA